MEIPKIVKEEAKRQGFEEIAAFLGSYNGGDIYSLGVNDKENWLPCPPLAPVIVAVKNNQLQVIEDEEAFDLALRLCEA